MTDERPRTVGTFDRRSLLKAGLLGAVGMTALAGEFAASTGVALADNGYILNGHQYAAQVGWSYCRNCSVLFWGPEEAISWCPIDGPHDNTGSSVYELLHNGATQAQVQVGWRFCTQCKAMFWGNDQSASVCSEFFFVPDRQPTHQFSSTEYIYDLMSGSWSWTPIPTDPTVLQAGWRWCKLCQSLFWGANRGLCPNFLPGQGPHLAGSSTSYVLIRET